MGVKERKSGAPDDKVSRGSGWPTGLKLCTTGVCKLVSGSSKSVNRVRVFLESPVR